MKKVLFFLIAMLVFVSGVYAVDSVVLLNSSSLDDMHDTIVFLESEGVIVNHVFPPSILYVEGDVSNHSNILEVSTGSLSASLDGVSEYGLDIWNSLHAVSPSYSRRMSAMQVSPAAIANDSLRYVSNSPVASAANLLGTSDYLFGNVMASIVFLESDGSIDVSTEDWSETKKNKVVSEIVNGMDWWIDQGSDANLTMFYEVADVNTSFEPISRTAGGPSLWSDEVLWVTEALNVIYPSAGYYLDRVVAYDQSLQSDYSVDWAFTIFMIDSENDVDGEFSNNYFAYAYVQGPLMVMTYDNDGYGVTNMDAVLAHEVGHIFGAADQYASSGCSCAAKFGFLEVENQNCERDLNTGLSCSSDVGSLMRGQISPFANKLLDDYAIGQLGWSDSDASGFVDAIETSFNSGLNSDNDSVIDQWDYDDDNDGVLDSSDLCPLVFGVVYHSGCPNYSPVIDSYTPALIYDSDELVSVSFNHSSSDLNNESLNYSWYVDASLVGNESSYEFITDYYSAGEYLVTLIVSDAFENVSLDWNLTINNINRLPVWESVPSNYSILEDANLSFDFNVSDLDLDDTLSFFINDSNFVITNSSVVYTLVSDWFGVNSVVVYLSDGYANVSASFEVEVVSVNDSPVSVLGSDRSVSIGDTVVLNGSSSYDVDGDSFDYAWTQLGGPSVVLNSTSSNSFIASEGVYTFELEVSDGALSSTDTVIITAAAAVTSSGGGGGGSGGGSSSASSTDVDSEVSVDVPVVKAKKVVVSAPVVEPVDVPVDEELEVGFFSRLGNGFSQMFGGGITGAVVAEGSLDDEGLAGGVLGLGLFLVAGVMGTFAYRRRR
jgi:hypothetical protein